MKTVTIKELRPMMPQVIDEIDSRWERYMITRHGHPVAVMMSADDYESLIETMNILGDREAMKGIERGMKDIKEGRVITLEEHLAKMKM